MNFLEILARTNFAMFPEWKLRAKLDENEVQRRCTIWCMPGMIYEELLNKGD